MLMLHLRLRHWIIGAGALVCLFAPNISFGTENQAVIYEFPPTLRDGSSFSMKIPHVLPYHLERGVFFYPFPNPAVLARATLFPLDCGLVDMSVFIQTAQKRLYCFDGMTTALRSGVISQGGGLPGRPTSRSFAKHFLWAVGGV
jgi:hypothetical protein